MHQHLDGKCPVSGKAHEFCPPQEGDIRSVCPALNAMANHGYIPRNGKNLTFGVLYNGLKACYGLSSALSVVLVTGGFVGIRRSPFKIPYHSAKNPDGTVDPSGVIDLHLIGLHNGVEHDASLVHLNTPDGEKYGPVEVQEDWVPKLVGDILPPVPQSLPSSPTSLTSSWSSSSESSSILLRKLITDPAYQSVLVNEDDVGRMRARRQREIRPKKLDGVHKEIARGEMAIILGVWKQVHGEGEEKKAGIPLPWLLQWLSEERLPEVPEVPLPTPSTNFMSRWRFGRRSSGGDGDASEDSSLGSSSSDVSAQNARTKMWRPVHTQSLPNVMKRSFTIRMVTNKIESGKMAA
jgi:hypothetical protein